MSEPWKCPDDRFPVLENGGLRRPITLPMAFVLSHEKAAMSNHGQTIQRLKERGGLGWGELTDIIAGRPWGGNYDKDVAHEYVMRALFRWQHQLKVDAR